MVEQSNYEQSEVQAALNVDPMLTNEEFTRSQIARRDLETMRKKYKYDDPQELR
jgi:hypothetical protein